MNDNIHLALPCMRACACATSNGAALTGWSSAVIRPKLVEHMDEIFCCSYNSPSLILDLSLSFFSHYFAIFWTHGDG